MSSDDAAPVAAPVAAKRPREPEAPPAEGAVAEDGADAAGRRVVARAPDAPAPKVLPPPSFATYYYLLSDDDATRWRALSAMVRTIGKERTEEALVAKLAEAVFSAGPVSELQDYVPSANFKDNLWTIKEFYLNKRAWEAHGAGVSRMMMDLHVLRAYLPL